MPRARVSPISRVRSNTASTSVLTMPKSEMITLNASSPYSRLSSWFTCLTMESLYCAAVFTVAEYKDSVVKQVNQLLNLLYGLLALSVIISLFGIVNTLVLAVFERTREIGLTRALGMSRRQVRATVRYESVITSVIGAAMGIVVGILFAWVVTTKFAGQGITFSIPGGQLVVFLIVAVIAGVIAAILPARAATRESAPAAPAAPAWPSTPPW